MKWLIPAFALVVTLYVVAWLLLFATFDAKTAARDVGRLWRNLSDGFTEGARR